MQSDIKTKQPTSATATCLILFAPQALIQIELFLFFFSRWNWMFRYICSRHCPRRSFDISLVCYLCDVRLLCSVPALLNVIEFWSFYCYEFLSSLDSVLPSVVVLHFFLFLFISFAVEFQTILCRAKHDARVHNCCEQIAADSYIISWSFDLEMRQPKEKKKCFFSDSISFVTSTKTENMNKLFSVHFIFFFFLDIKIQFERCDAETRTRAIIAAAYSTFWRSEEWKSETFFCTKCRCVTTTKREEQNNITQLQFNS